MKPAQLLLVARFARPGRSWRVTPDGTVMDAQGNMFNLASRADCEAAQFRLFDKGWIIKEVTRRGEPYYQANRRHGSRMERRRIEDLIVECVAGEIGLICNDGETR